MSPLQALEKTAKLGHHLAAHAYAEQVYGHVLDLIRDGHDRREVREAVRVLHRRARESHHTVERDAYVEVLDTLDDEYPPFVA